VDEDGKPRLPRNFSRADLLGVLSQHGLEFEPQRLHENDVDDLTSHRTPKMTRDRAIGEAIRTGTLDSLKDSDNTPLIAPRGDSYRLPWPIAADRENSV